jgi:hypothetical protein
MQVIFFVQLIEDKAKAIREISWQGRSGGIDNADGPDAIREPFQAKRKFNKRVDLPPLSDIDVNPVSLS